MNMFVCAARKLSPSSSSRSDGSGEASRSGTNPPGSAPHSAPVGYFEVNILERHPFTTQTFSPLSSTSQGKVLSDSRNNGYLVIVAPNQEASSSISSGGAHQNQNDALANLPDLAKIKAFVATANQAVTYGAGTWHAPMVALGPEGSTVDFVVTQFANGVAQEDCQEVVFGKGALDDGSIHVRVPTAAPQKLITAKL